MKQYDAIILAGGINSGELQKYAPYESEALIIIGSSPMIYYVVQAVRASKKVRRIIISGPVESLREYFKKESDLFFSPSGDDAIDSFANAVDLMGPEELTSKVLVLPTDIPFITPEAIDDFLNQCEREDSDFYYAIVKKEANEARFPRVVRTYARLKEGVFTGGNLFLVRTSIISQCVDMGKKLVAKRKNPIALARLLGLSLVIRFLFRRLSISDAENRFEKVLGIKGKAIISEYAEVGVDVDKPSDLKLAEKILGNVPF